MFRHCVYKRACIFLSYDHVHREKEKKSPKEKNGLNRDVVATISHNKYRYIIE